MSSINHLTIVSFVQQFFLNLIHQPNINPVITAGSDFIFFSKNNIVFSKNNIVLGTLSISSLF